MATTFLNLDLPVVTVTLGPTWANEVNAAFEVIDVHDHTSGKGVQIPTAGLNINADLDFNENALQNVQFLSFEQRTTSPTGSSFAGSVSIFDNDLYYTNTSGVAVQITAGGGLVPSAGNAQVFEIQNVGSDLVISPSATFVYLIVDTTTTRTISLPLANSVTSGRIYVIKDSDGQANTNPITVQTQGSDLVDGASSQTLDSDYGSYFVVTDGASNWFIS